MSNCLLPNEEIFVNDGYKEIEDVEVNDTVMSHDGKFYKVTKKFEFTKPTYYFSLSDGQHIECANTHRFLINKTKIDKNSSWKTAEELHDGDEIFAIDIMKTNTDEGIVKYTRYKIIRKFHTGTNRVIDLTIEDSHNYISANGIINHNCN